MPLAKEESSFEDIKERAKNVKEEIKSEYQGFFKKKTDRERFSASRKIYIDPGSFLIGGIGAIAIASVADESSAGDRETSDGALFTNSTLRTIMYPIRTMIRFFTGGCIYVAVDSLSLHMLDQRSPILSGAVTGLCFANGARTSVFLGSMLGMAVFSQIADMIVDKAFNRNFLDFM